MISTYHDFRQFYNQVVHPELLNMERRRRRLVRLMTASLLLFACCTVLAIYINTLVFTLLLMLPLGFWIAYIGFRIQVFFLEFKPRIVGLVLDFIDNDVNYSDLNYSAKGKIAKSRFLESLIFARAEDYEGEDLITGKVRETEFAMSELRVSEFSAVRSKLDQVFKGVFIIGDYYNLEMKGSLLVLPDEYMKYLSRTARAFHLKGGRRVHGQALPEFEAWFNTYCTPDMRIRDVLSEDFQRELLAFRKNYQQLNRRKDIYLSIIGDNIYIAVSQDRDLLEPSLWSNTVDFSMVQEFHDDITLLLRLILKIDALN
jgi:hypothetical protein